MYELRKHLTNLLIGTSSIAVLLLIVIVLPFHVWADMILLIPEGNSTVCNYPPCSPMLCSTTSVCNTDASNTDASNTGFISGIVTGAVIGILGFLAALYLKRRQGEKTRAISTQSEGIQSLLKHITSVYQANLDNKVSPEQFNGIVEQARELAKKYGKTFRIDLDTALDGLKALAASQTTTNIAQSKEHDKSSSSDQTLEAPKNSDINTDSKTVSNTPKVNNIESTLSGEYSFVRKWGSPGTANGQFNSPYDIAIDSSGNVYVADLGNNRIQKFTADGTFIRKWGTEGEGEGRKGKAWIDSSKGSGELETNDVNYAYKYLKMPEIVMDIRKAINRIARQTAGYERYYHPTMTYNN